MHDPERVRFGDGLAGLKQELDGLLDAQRSLLGQPGAEVGAVEELHDDVRRAVLQRADVDDPGDVLALDLDRRSGLAVEPRHRLLIGGGLGEQEFQRDALVELQVVRGDDDAHAARAEDALDPVLSSKDIADPNPCLFRLHDSCLPARCRSVNCFVPGVRRIDARRVRYRRARFARLTERAITRLDDRGGAWLSARGIRHGWIA